MKFRKKPVVIDAMQHTGSKNSFHLLRWIESLGVEANWNFRGESLYIETLEGEMRADPGDWIIVGVNGEQYPCKPDIFNQTYEVATND